MRTLLRNIVTPDILLSSLLILFGVGYLLIPAFSWYGRAPGVLGWFCIGGTGILGILADVALVTFAKEHRLKFSATILVCSATHVFLGMRHDSLAPAFPEAIVPVLLVGSSVLGLAIICGGLSLIWDQLKLLPEQSAADETGAALL